MKPDHSVGADHRLEHVDKGDTPRVPEDAFAAIVEQNLMAFQGHPADGIFENGTDLATRLQCCAGGRVALNGGGGEVFRNFFYLPDRSFSVKELLWTFYGAFNPAWCSAAFDEGIYLSNLAQKMKRVLDLDGDRLSRVDIEAVYPLFRCRYWMGKNNSVNSNVNVNICRSAWNGSVNKRIYELESCNSCCYTCYFYIVN